MQEPGCAVRSAVINQQISARRYESYRRLFRLYEKLAVLTHNRSRNTRASGECDRSVTKVPPSTYSSSPPTGRRAPIRMP